MILFNSDYTEGAHPKILDLLQKTNMEQTTGYGEDHYCEKAKRLISQQCNRTDIDVHFLVGGTQANLTAITAALRPHQGVISTEGGHISVHESGAVEATGHKVITVNGKDGKLLATHVEAICEAHLADVTREHTVQPKMAYISNATECGTVYTRGELADLSRACKKYNLYLYMDGARLGYALACKKNDLDLEAIAQYCDLFYIGGTKQGTLFGEALVITNPCLKPDFRYIIKQRGGMLAKGRLLGLQFTAMFEDKLYFDLSRHANDQAERIRMACADAGIPFHFQSDANQIFVVLSDRQIELLNHRYVFSYWERVDASHSAVRICTSWATTEDNVDSLIRDLIANI